MTPRRREIHRMMIAYQAEHGFPATLREIAAAMGFSSTNALTGHMRALVEAGLVVCAAGTGCSRRYVAVPSPPPAIEAIVEPPAASIRRAIAARVESPATVILEAAEGAEGSTAADVAEAIEDRLVRALHLVRALRLVSRSDDEVVIRSVDGKLEWGTIHAGGAS